jgi:hypothetical protein
VLQGAAELTPDLAPKLAPLELPTMPLEPVRIEGGPMALASGPSARFASSAATPLLGAHRPRAPSPSPPAALARANLPLLVGIALGFLLIGVGLAVVLMRFVLR